MGWEPGWQRRARAHHGDPAAGARWLPPAGQFDPRRPSRARLVGQPRTGVAAALHAVSTALLALALASTTGCASSGPAVDDSVSLPTAASTAPVSTPGPGAADTPENTASSGGTTSGSEGSTSPQEEVDAPEQPSQGSTGVSIELAGLPVGGGGALTVGDAWCQVLAWGKQLPDGVTLEIDAVTFREQDALLHTAGCGQAPACQGIVIGPEDAQTCAVLVRPPTADTPFLTGRLDGILNCPDEQTCEAVGATDGAEFRIDNPGGGGAEDGDGTGTNGQNSSGGSGNADPQQTGDGSVSTSDAGADDAGADGEPGTSDSS